MAEEPITYGESVLIWAFILLAIAALSLIVVLIYKYPLVAGGFFGMMTLLFLPPLIYRIIAVAKYKKKWFFKEIEEGKTI
jgi:hypothetical protein